MKSSLPFIVLCLLAAQTPHSLFAAGDDKLPAEQNSPEDAIQKHWLKVSRTYAESFTLSETDNEAKPYQLYEKPIFLHTQSVRGDDIGAVHLWLTDDKRPAVIGAVFSWSDSNTSRMVSYELHSLVQEPIQLSFAGRHRWTSKTKGFDWKSFAEGTPPPAEKPAAQRLQSKQLARRFSANSTSDKNQRWELRPIPTPIYQYESKPAGVTHGAIFAFCQGTDTEVILLIEAFETESKNNQTTLQWRYGLAPFSDYKLRVELSDEEVWESPPGAMRENGKPHYWNFIEQSPKPEFEIENKE